MTEGSNEVAQPTIVIDVQSSIALIRIHRPAARNSLSMETLGELDSGVSDLTARPDISALIITGTGDVFTSGADIRELRALTPATAREFSVLGQLVFQRIADAPQLTIAAINGYCMGGGLDLALACDLRYAAPTAVFAHPGARLGIITGWGGTQRLARLVGSARALEMFATAKRMTSAEAFAIGLVDRINEDVVEAAMQTATRAKARQAKL